MLKISKLADYATVVMVLFARNSDALFTAKQVSDKTHLNLPTVSKLLKLLTLADLLLSQRGTKGGYQLSQSAEKIAIVDIIEAIEGKLTLTECSENHNQCSIEETCQTKGNWQLITKAVQVALQSVSLADFAVSQSEPNQFKINVNDIKRVMTHDTNTENA